MKTEEEYIGKEQHMKAMYNVRFLDLFNVAIFHVIMRSFIACFLLYVYIVLYCAQFNVSGT